MAERIEDFFESGMSIESIERLLACKLPLPALFVSEENYKAAINLINEKKAKCGGLFRCGYPLPAKIIYKSK